MTRLSTVQLVKEIARKAGLLVKKQIALAKTELKSDARTEAKVAGGLGLAAVGAIITVTLLLVTGGVRAGAGDAGVGRGIDRQRRRGGRGRDPRGRELEPADSPAAAAQPGRAETGRSLHEGALRMSAEARKSMRWNATSTGSGTTSAS